KWPGPMHNAGDGGHSGPDIATQAQKREYMMDLQRTTYVKAPLGIIILILIVLYNAGTNSFPVERLLFLIIGVQMSYPMAREVYDSSIADMERRTGLSAIGAVKDITIGRMGWPAFGATILSGALIEIMPPGVELGNAFVPMTIGFWLGAFPISAILANRRFIRRLEADQGGNFIVNR
ncbi:MAG: hypothetical protein OEV92_02600, partial [Nitrospinota bacterium]|nr:hypothetical protein [Nitrospinota bacterium]